MASKTRRKVKVNQRAKTRETHNQKNEMKPNSSLLMMLSSQLLGSGRFNEGLPSFVMRGLDSEQIWQQLELRNSHKLSLPACTREVVRISIKRSGKDKIKSASLRGQPPKTSSNPENSESSESEAEDGDRMLNAIKKRLEDSDGSEDNELDELSNESDEDELDFDFQLENEALTADAANNGTVLNGSASKKSGSKSSVKTTSVVDDKFFKLADAEKFLDSEDLKEEKRRQKEDKGTESVDDDNENENDGEDIDLFGSVDSDDNTESAKYEDFFAPPDDDGEEQKAQEKGAIKIKKQKIKDTEDSSENEDYDEENQASGDEADSEEDIEQEIESLVESASESDMSDDDDEENTNTLLNRVAAKKQLGDKTEKHSKSVSFAEDLLKSENEDEAGESGGGKSAKFTSTFELKQQQLQAKAREMEDQSLKDPSWELTGEVSSSKRPENSLLDTVLDFQHTAKAAPVITDETTKTLEDYIRQRIKDKTFDDVERKEKPKEDVFEFKKRIVLDQDKSKQSLGELYEQEFLKQQQTETEEVKADPECEKIEKELNKLFKQLDALSNFRFTPMRPGTEVKILVNTPAISMEEVAPVATADSELLAPEEVHEKKKGELKAQEERSTTDKKRAHRLKKKEKRERKKAKESREKLVEKLKPGLGNKYSKEKALRQLEQISKTDKNVAIVKGEHKRLSSTKFFTQLQEEVQTNAMAKKANRKKKKVTDASKLML